MRLGRQLSRDLTRISLVLSPQGANRARISIPVLVASALTIGMAATLLATEPQGFDPIPRSALAAPSGDRQLVVDKRLEEMKLSLSVSEARGHELERQIETLNQRLRDSQEELTFFRKTRDGRR